MSGYLVWWEVCVEVTYGWLKAGYGLPITPKCGFSTGGLVRLVWALDMGLMLDPESDIGSLGTVFIGTGHTIGSRLESGG